MLAFIAAALPLSLLIGWLVSRLPHHRIRTLAATIAVAVAVIAALFDAGPCELLPAAIVVLAVLILTGLGVGSCSVGRSMTLSHLATVGALAVGPCPWFC